MLEENVDLAAFLSIPEMEVSDKPQGAALAPTPENLKMALGKANVATELHLHEASGIEFKLRAMSSDGYTALNNVTQVNPMTGFPMSTAQEDEFERNLIYLTFGIAQPALDRNSAIAILKSPGWGPSNVRLIDAIKNLNPSAEERVNNFILLMQSSRFSLILFHILDEIGAIDDLADNYKLTDNTRLSLKMCISSFRKLYKVEFAARAWGLPLTADKLIAHELEAEPETPEPEKEEEEASDDSTKEHQENSS